MKQVMYPFGSFEMQKHDKEKETTSKEYATQRKNSIGKGCIVGDVRVANDGGKNTDEYEEDKKYAENEEYKVDRKTVEDEQYETGEKNDGIRNECEHKDAGQYVKDQSEQNARRYKKIEIEKEDEQEKNSVITFEQEVKEKQNGKELREEDQCLSPFIGFVYFSPTPSTSFVLLDIPCEEKTKNITIEKEKNDEKDGIISVVHKATECSDRKVECKNVNSNYQTNEERGEDVDSRVLNEVGFQIQAIEKEKKRSCDKTLKETVTLEETMANEETCANYVNKCNAVDSSMQNLMINKRNINNDENRIENNNPEIDCKNENEVDRNNNITNDYHLKNQHLNPYVAPSSFPSGALSVYEQLHNLRNFKVTIVVSSIGNAPRLKQSKFLINGNSRFASVVEFLKRALKRNKKDVTTVTNNASLKNDAILNENNEENQQLFVYINNAIEPQLDDYVADLFNVFSVANCLRVSYSFNPAY